VKWGFLGKNPMSSGTPPKPVRADPPAWGEQELPPFLLAIDGHRLRIVFILNLTTGLRRGELLRLSWRDLNLERRLLKVGQALVATSQKGIVLQSIKTGGSRRPIVLPEEAVRLLKAHQLEQENEKALFGETHEDSDLVCCQPDGRRLDPRSFARQFERVVRKSGLPRIPPEGLRHTHATLLSEAAINPKVVQEMPGHTEIGTTMDIYSRVLPSIQHAAADAMNDMIRKLQIH
jgi:integrase